MLIHSRTTRLDRTTTPWAIAPLPQHHRFIYVATGTGALVDNTTGWGNSGFGADALSANTTGMENTGIGDATLENNTTGSGNWRWALSLSLIRLALSYQLQGANTAVGYRALCYTGAEWGTGVGGDGNTAVGDRAMLYNVDGSFNCAFGLLALSTMERAIQRKYGNWQCAGYGLRTGIGMSTSVNRKWPGIPARVSTLTSTILTPRR